ncbi:hypothetical protein 1 [Shuangao toti-like virus]|uniref:Uncharacterized protein n=1 Tax=Shuangao toti-like virus TaxID=1923477 RepID=A0A1L3KF21_9VIRU|nr:hypothetical protein 1 [Shuangao toti-like virus]APG76010.1 hypothetical protein 1 [Shuangao toti-like virus]
MVYANIDDSGQGQAVNPTVDREFEESEWWVPQGPLEEPEETEWINIHPEDIGIRKEDLNDPVTRRKTVTKLMIANKLTDTFSLESSFQRASAYLTEWERGNREKTLLGNRSNKSKESNECKIFRGDVASGVEALWEATKMSSGDGMEESALWSLLNGAGPSNPRVYNNRTLTKYEEEGAKLGVGSDQLHYHKSMTYTRTEVPRSNSNKDKGTETKVKEEIVKVGRLKDRAAKMAINVYTSYRKTLGIMSGNVKNRIWTKYVASKLARLVGSNILIGWERELINKCQLSEMQAKKKVSMLAHSIRIWSLEPTDDPEEDKLKVKEPDNEDVESETLDVRRMWFVSGLISSKFGESTVNGGVCPYCIYHEIEGSTPKAVIKAEGIRECKLPLRDSKSWVYAAAIKHNKEMHALNGNIASRILLEGESRREDCMSRDRVEGWDRPPIRCIIRENWIEILEEAEKYSGRVYYSDGNHGGRTSYAGAGTLHEVCKGDLTLPAAEVLPQQHQAGGSGMQDDGRPGLPPATRSGKIYGPNWSREASERHRTRGEDQTWISVGLDRNKHHGKIVMTEMGDEMTRALRDPEDKTGLINLNRSRNIYNYIVGGGSLAQSVNHCNSSDWRELGLRICLYDDLRERRFTQPTGVDWAIAKKDEIRTEYVATKPEHKWGYKCVCVNWRYLDKFLKIDGRMPVGPNMNDIWYLNSDEVTVIALGDNSNDSGIGREAWILSHLDYPLIHAVDTFSIGEIRRVGVPEYSEKTFVRTSSLIDIPNKARNLVFVLMSDSQDTYTLGGVTFTVPRVDRFDSIPAGTGPRVVDCDPIIDAMLNRVMMSPECIRMSFERYCGGYFPTGLDWMEVDNLATVLKVRWHNRMSVGVEDTPTGKVKEYKYMPTGFARQCGITLRNSIGIDNYGSNDAVTCLDHVFVKRADARSTPVLRIGRWDCMSELGVASGFAVYNSFDTENKDRVISRISAGGMDSLLRAAYWRRIVEMWKRQNGIRDEIASPGSYPNLDNYWTMFVEETREGGPTLSQMAEVLCKGKYCTWSWRVNELKTILPSVTGSRTPSSWWRGPLNETWKPFLIGGNENHPSDTYHLNTVRTEWCYNHWEPQDRGTDDFHLESVLNRINLEKGLEGIEYIGLPSRSKVGNFGYHVECQISGILARSAGWVKSYDKSHPVDNSIKWTWGLNVIIRDWEHDTLKKICLEANVASLLEAGYFLERTQLFRGSETLPVGGSNRDYLYRLPTTDMSLVMGNSRASSKQSDPSKELRKTTLNIVSDQRIDPDEAKHQEEKSTGLTTWKGSDKKKLMSSTEEKKTGSAVLEIKKIPEVDSKGSGLTKATVGGIPTVDTSQSQMASHQNRKEVERVMVTAEVQPKIGSTKEDAKYNLDHRKKQDEN